MSERWYLSFEDELHGWRPDWADDSRYSFYDHLDGREWAWQFVRRNPDYQFYWIAEEGDCEGALQAADAASDSDSFSLMPSVLPEMEEFDSGVRFTEGVHFDECAREWGFHPPTNPAIDEPFLTFLSERTGDLLDPGRVTPVKEFLSKLDRRKDRDDSHHHQVRKVLVEGDTYREIGVEQTNAAVAMLDLDQELFWQLKKVEANARALQRRVLGQADPKALGRKLGDLTLYLRVLDADAAQAERLEMARTLWPNLYGAVEPKPAKPPKRNRDLMRRERKKAELRREALQKVRSTLTQARNMTKPSGYLRLVKSQPGDIPQ